MSYIGNPEQIWTKSMSVWSCSPSVPAVVEGLCLIQREQKWNSWTWMKQNPQMFAWLMRKAICLMVWFLSYFLKIFFSLEKANWNPSPSWGFAGGQCQQEWEVSEGQEDGEKGTGWSLGSIPYT